MTHVGHYPATFQPMAWRHRRVASRLVGRSLELQTACWKITRAATRPPQKFAARISDPPGGRVNFPWHWLRRLVARMPTSVAHRVNHDDYFTKPSFAGASQQPHSDAPPNLRQETVVLRNTRGYGQGRRPDRTSAGGASRRYPGPSTTQGPQGRHNLLRQKLCRPFGSQQGDYARYRGLRPRQRFCRAFGPQDVSQSVFLGTPNDWSCGLESREAGPCCSSLKFAAQSCRCRSV